MIIMYGISNCDTVKKAKLFLADNNIDFEFIDFRKNPINEKTLLNMVNAIGWEKLINKRSTTYRNLTENEKTSIDINLVLKNITLIKRPILINGVQILVGFNKDLYQNLL